MLKWGQTPAGAMPYPWIVLANNTYRTTSNITITVPKGSQTTATNGPYPNAGGPTINTIALNNILSVASSIGAEWSSNVDGRYLVEDYNQYEVAGAAPSVRNGGLVTATSLAAWQAAGFGAHDQPAGGTGWQLALDANFTDPNNGDLTLLATATGLIAKGTPLNNLRDLPTATGSLLPAGGYYGAAPSLGAVEFVPAGLPFVCPDLSMMGLGT